MPTQYIDIFQLSKMKIFSRKILKFLLFLLKTYIAPRQFLASTHNLYFGAKIRKIGIPLHIPVLLYKSRVQGGIHYMDMFS